jgi:anti-sigma-K factor RskA
MNSNARDEFLRDERLADLLAQEATEGLGAAEKAELERLLGAHPGADREALERVASALMLAGDLDAEPLPAGLRGRLVEQGQQWVAAAKGAGGAQDPRTAVAAAASVTSLPEAREARAARRGAVPAHSAHWGWWVAAAAVVIAVVGWYPRLANTPSVPVASEVPPPPQPAAAQLREELLRVAASRLVRWDWATTEDPAAAGVTGDVVWDPVTQKGYMRFVGLPANDAKQNQYQLWIFDAERDERYPVDGGVFDVPAGRTEVVVPIDARLGVAKPALFAVTVEKPGGVVVSSRERIVVLAKPAQA